MIKLNSKNITYVALADSANSLKAPKEVWYADSNNSVKLVYRRKDALIEGEDYEKYHWLVSDGDCYINTLQKYRPYSDSIDLITKDNLYPNRETNLNKYNWEEFMFGYYSTEFVRVCAYIPTILRVGVNVLKYNNSNPPDWITYCASTNVNSNSIHNIHLNKVTDNKYSFEYNGTTFNDRTTVLEFPSNYEVQGFLYLFNLNNPNPTTVKHYFNGAFNTYIHYRDDIAIQNLIPCKLLKPVPKWLDANGIRRQIGECGMIDLVSGKFYGNVNSVGTFTVENYYERKEWLCGRNGAYINTNHKLVTIEDRFDVKARLDDDLTRENDLFGYLTDNQNDRTYSIAIFHNLFGSNLCTSYCNYYGNAGTFRPIQHPISPNIPFTLSLYADSNEYHSVCNGNEIQQTTNGMTTDTYDDVYLFNMNIGNPAKKSEQLSRYFNGDIAYFIISNNNVEVIHLVPCTLTMDLPASMDANNIARTKGTSGMWDLVSDRFYGNVANSGTFKAVNLAEGVDYEVHDWLIGDGSAYIDTNVIVNTATLKLKFNCYNKSDRGGCICGSRNTASLGTDTTAIHFQNSQYRLDIISVHPNYQWAPKNTFDSFDIDLSTNTVTISGTTITFTKTHTNSSNTFRVFGCALASDGYLGGLNDFIIDDGSHVFNLIPVKLLRSIPSKYDANGIARNAGECGMYDTVNDKFYGNVASSGTFSVSDDS